MQAGPWCSLLTHLTSRCLCRSGPLPPPGSPGLTAPAPVGAGRAPQGCCWGSLGVTGGWGSFPPPLEAPESHKGLECSGDRCVRGPETPRGCPAVEEAERQLLWAAALTLPLNHPKSGAGQEWPARWTACSYGRILTWPLTELGTVSPYAGHLQGSCDRRLTAWPEGRPPSTSNRDRPA